MTNTVDVKEIEQFSLLSNKWWDRSGPFSALHKLSNARIEFIKNNASRIISHKNLEAKFLNFNNSFLSAITECFCEGNFFDTTSD